MKVSGVHHITLRSQDPPAMRRFYEEVIGLSFMEIPVSGDVTSIWKGAPPEGVLVATQAGSTILVIQPPLEGTPDGDRFSEYRIGVDHLALGVEDRAELDALVERLRAAGVETRGIEIDVVLGKEYVAFRDPDNIQWEAYLAV
jgi:catechol 2,3-dioxygenase-like lactoylglutathione lyase family enzyme